MMFSQIVITAVICFTSLTHWELETKLSESLSFWQSLDNFITSWSYVYCELEKNVSLLFVNQQLPISYVRSNIPKIVEIGGFHVSKRLTTLPKDVQNILDEATQGFVYMSLGSNAKSSMLPNETLNQFIAAFSKLSYKVLWKFENDVLPGKPDNVHIIKWVPQQAVL